jgi:quercetin dioxygenase-like cupin family protein
MELRMAIDMSDIKVNPSEEVIRFGGLEIRFLTTSADSNGSLSTFEFSVPAGMKLPGPPHFNDGYEELAYGLEGTLTWTVNGKDVEVGPGQTLCIRRGNSHTWANRGTVPAKQLTVVSPGIMGPEYFREVAQAVNAGGPPNPAAMVETMRRHGMVPLG